MVYEFIPNRTRRIEFVGDDGSSITLVANSTPRAILRTCQFIKEEAWDILNRFLNSREDDPAPRIEADLADYEGDWTLSSIVADIVMWYRTILQSTGDYIEIFELFKVAKTKHYIKKRKYRLKNGTKAEGKLEVAQFMRNAGWALAHQRRIAGSSTCSNSDVERSSDPTGRPLFHVALRSISPSKVFALYQLEINIHFIMKRVKERLITKFHILSANMSDKERRSRVQAFDKRLANDKVLLHLIVSKMRRNMICCGEIVNG